MTDHNADGGPVLWVEVRDDDRLEPETPADLVRSWIAWETRARWGGRYPTIIYPCSCRYLETGKIEMIVARPDGTEYPLGGGV